MRNCWFVVLFLVRSYQWVLFQAQNHGTHGCSCCTKSTYCSTLELQVVRLYGPTSPRDETMICTSRTLTDLNVSEQNPKNLQQQLARPKLPLIGLIENPTQNPGCQWRHQRGIVWLSRWRWEGVKEYGDRLGLKNTRWICLNVHRDDSWLQKLRLKVKMLLRIFEGSMAAIYWKRWPELEHLRFQAEGIQYLLARVSSDHNPDYLLYIAGSTTQSHKLHYKPL